MTQLRLNLEQYWYCPSYHWVTFLLLPFSWCFAFCAAVRRSLYRLGVKKTYRFSVPVIVVGNITTGGAGKTPLVIGLATFLKSQGFSPGIVSRGVGGKKHAQPYWVRLEDEAKEVGDEALLLVRHTHCPVVIGADRVAVVQALLTHVPCDVVISDDGLQHYRLGRDIEIAVVDGARRFGNGCLLPAGPLREPLTRLKRVDFIVTQGEADKNAWTMTLRPGDLTAVQDSRRKMPIAEFPDKRVHAIAAIGHPERFFTQLKQQGFDVIPHAFKDHYLYRPEDIHFPDTLPIIMTEKDAVKCVAFANERCWYLPVTAEVSEELKVKILEKLNN